MNRCQTCRSHSNNPSFCEWHELFVGRKDPACPKGYKESKKKVAEMLRESALQAKLKAERDAKAKKK